MSASRKQNVYSIPKESKEIEAITMSRKSIRKIRKCPGAKLKQTSRKCPGAKLKQTSGLQFVFGPHYRDEQKESCKKAKKEAWLKILGHEQNNHDHITGSYMTAMTRIEEKARAAYDKKVLDRFTESDFRWMMIEDGCLFLNLALHMLGEKHSKKTVQKWIKSMFLVGNQIPLVVLNELMKQDFYQNIIGDGKKLLSRSSEDMLSKQILYDLLVTPAIKYKKTKTMNSVSGKTNYLLQDQELLYSDLLHGLQMMLLLGRGGSSRTDSTENEREDELEVSDLEAGIEFKSSSNPKADGRKEVIYMTDNKIRDGERKNLCASEFSSKGILIRKSNTGGIRGICFGKCKSNTGGIRGIHFGRWMIFATLTLPTLKLNHDINVLLTNFKYYEITHQQKEVTSYLRFLSEIISTYEDLNVLDSEGIIEVSNLDEKERFLEMLKTLAADSGTTHDHRYVLGRIKDHTLFPWKYFKYLGILAILIAIAQIFIAGFSYRVALKQLHHSRLSTTKAD